MPVVQFVSDLHLDPGRPDITCRFLRYLENHGRDAEAVYILGDLFETWIGDDDDSPLSWEIIGGLKACTDAGTSLFMLHGNRDFLLGGHFAEACGCTLLNDPASIDLFGQTALLMHGDTLCTDDTDYLAFRHKVRSHEWQQDFLGKPVATRYRIAGELRDASRTAGRYKTGKVMEVNPEAVIRVMQEHGARLLIHGHTHTQTVQQFAIDGQPATRIALGSWDTGASVLEYSPDGYRFEKPVTPS